MYPVDSASLFAGLAASDKAAFMRHARTRRLTRGELLFAHGDPVTSLYLITCGSVQLFRTTHEGQQKTIALVKAGQPLCEDEIMDACHGRRTSGVAVEDSELLEFPVARVKEMARENGTFALNLLSLVAARLHLAEVEAEHQAAMSAAQLVACFLQRMCVLYDFNQAGFELPYSKTLIASRLGMEVKTFSRTIAKLKDHGISVEGNHVAILDLKAVGKYVCSACSVAGSCNTHQAMEIKTAH